MRFYDRFMRRTAWIYWREQLILCQFRSFLPAQGTVLDIGTGSGKLAQLVRDQLELSVTVLDVVDHNVSDLPLKLYNGKRLPYEADSFDVCLLVFVLHHAENVETVIREALRASRSRVIIVEDTPETKFARLAWRRWDDWLNNEHHKDVAIAHGTHTSSEWPVIFKRCGAKKVQTKSFRALFPVLAMYPHSVFVLEK